MGNAASASLTVEAILKVVSDPPNPDGAQDLEKHKEVLAKHGVQTNESTSREDLATCAVLLETSGFWSKHFKLHPNQSRVKNWLWVHQKYRDQTKSMVDMIAGGGGPKLKAAFEKLEGKIKSHSDFEDEQLFSFFEKQIPESGESMRLLKADHEETTDSSRVVEALNDGSNTENIRSALETYQKQLIEHLRREEDAVLPLWLSLSDEQYKLFQSGLSWKYKVMYR